ncbi:MAG: hypothetical protein WC120_05285 [Parcubacteria group bacterium]|jgi:hypothetical protein
MKARLNAYDGRGAPIMRTGSIGQWADPAPACAKPKRHEQVIYIMDEAANVEIDGVTPVCSCLKGEKRPSLREVALSVLARLADGRREW